LESTLTQQFFSFSSTVSLDAPNIAAPPIAPANDDNEEHNKHNYDKKTKTIKFTNTNCRSHTTTNNATNSG
jgi:hypothetical protein